MREKMKNTMNVVKDFLSKYEFTKRKALTAGSTVVSFALVIALAITFSPVNSDADIELQAADIEPAEIVIASNGLPYGEIKGYIDGVFVATEVYAVVVDDEDIVYLISDEEAQGVLDGIMSRFQTPGSEIINLWFAEDVSIERREFEWPAPVFSIGDAVNYVVTGTTAPQTYIVQGGDNLWDIAIAHGIRLSELEEMNPGINPSRLQIGMELYVYQTQPFLTVSFTERVTAQERISYGVIFEDTDSMYRGQTQVRIAGTYGSRTVTSEITRENGVIVGTRVISEELLSEPVTQVALRGTKPLPVVMGSTGTGPATAAGQFAHPVSNMRVISNFGSRGGRLHRGVDLGGPVGTPIYAAADGVVTRSTNSGSFGNVIFISHGNGVETVYAHNTTNLVSVGDTVVQGQKIATMGATGNATAPHLHFEIRINGQSYNPMNFL